MNRVDVVDLVVDLVDVDLDVDLPAVFLFFCSRLFQQYFPPAVFGAVL